MCEFLLIFLNPRKKTVKEKKMAYGSKNAAKTRSRMSWTLKIRSSPGKRTGLTFQAQNIASPKSYKT